MNTVERRQELLSAIKGGDLIRLKTLLLEGGDINAIQPNGKTLLSVAVETQNREIVEYLIQAHADLDQRDFYDRTPLMYGAEKRDVSVVRLLLQAGADVNAKNALGRTALMYAAYNDSVNVAETLLNAGAEINARDYKERSAFNYSVYKKRGQCYKLLKRRHAADSGPTSDLGSFIHRIFFADEFTELKQFSDWRWNDIAWSYFGIFMVFGVPDCGLFLGLLALINPVQTFLGYIFTSTLKLFVLAWEVLLRYSPYPQSTHPAPVHLIQETNDQGDLEFMSHLMELGSGELASIHRRHSTPHSRTVKASLFVSRTVSILLAGSIFALLLIPWIWTILPIWMLIVNKLEHKLRFSRLQLVQKERDRIAGEISILLNAEDFRKKELPPDFGLYLRAFMTTDKLHINGFDLETMLAYSIAPTLPLLALGKPGEHLGSGRIQTTNDHWQEEILRLMDAARMILIIPSHRAGTLWEISTLRQRGYFKKTIFIMPPALEFHGGRYSDDWERTVIMAQGYGVEFPNHIPRGAFFRLNADGEFEKFAPFVPDQFVQEYDPDAFVPKFDSDGGGGQ